MLKQTTQNFWGNLGEDIAMPLFFLCPEELECRGKWPGKLPSIAKIKQQLQRSSHCFIRKTEESRLLLSIGHLLLQAEAKRGPDERIYLELPEHSIHFVGSDDRSEIRQRGRILLYDGIYLLSEREFARRYDEWDSEGKFQRIFQNIGAKVAANTAIGTSTGDRECENMLRRYIEVECELQQQISHNKGPYEYVEAQPYDLSDSSSVCLLEMSPEDHRQLRYDRPKHLEILLDANGKTVPCEIQDLHLDADSHEIVVRLPAGFSFRSIPGQGKVRACAPPLPKRMKLAALDALATGNSANCWLLPLISGSYSPSPLTTVEVPPSEIGYSLDETQLKAVEAGVGSDDYLLICGPAGTGKSMVISSFLRYFASRKQKVLLCAQNDAALEEVLSSINREFDCLRIGGDFSEPVQESSLEGKTVAWRRELYENLQKSQHLVQIVDLLADTLACLRVISLNAKKRSAFAQRQQNIIEELRDAPNIACYREIQNILAIFEQVRGDFPLYLDYVKRSEVPAIQKKLAVLDRRLSVLHKKRMAMRRRLTALTRKWLVEANQGSLLARTMAKLLRKILWRTAAIRSLGVKIWELEQEIRHRDGELDRQQLEWEEIQQKISSFPQMQRRINSYNGDTLHQILNSENYRCLRLQLFVDDYSPQTLLEELQKTHRMLKTAVGLQKSWQRALEDASSDEIAPLPLSMADIVATTCDRIHSEKSFNDATFDLVIVDEAQQIPIHNLLVPLSRAKKAILLGDHKQIFPGKEELHKELQRQGLIAHSPVASEGAPGFSEIATQSCFEIIWRQKNGQDRKILLETQYKIPDAISDFLATNFYDGRYRADISVKHVDSPLRFFSNPLIFIDTTTVANRNERADRQGGKKGYLNPFETRVAIYVLARALAEKPEWGEQRIGILSFFAKHVEHLREEIHKAQEQGDFPSPLAPVQELVAAVEDSLGWERELLILVFTRSNREGRIGILEDVRQLATAMALARRQLVMIGDFSTLANISTNEPEHRQPFKSLMRNLRSYIDDRGCYLNAEDFYEPPTTAEDEL